MDANKTGLPGYLLQIPAPRVGELQYLFKKSLARSALTLNLERHFHFLVLRIE